MLPTYDPNPTHQQVLSSSSIKQNIFQGSDHHKEERASLLVLVLPDRKLEQSRHEIFFY